MKLAKRIPDHIVTGADPRSTQTPEASATQGSDPGWAGPTPTEEQGSPTAEGLIEVDNNEFCVQRVAEGVAVVLFKGCRTEESALEKEAQLAEYGFNAQWDRVGLTEVADGFEVSYERQMEAAPASMASRMAGLGSDEEEATDAEEEMRLANEREVAVPRPTRAVRPPPEGVTVREAHLSSLQRRRMPSSEFALPAKREGGKGGYPIDTRGRAVAALGRSKEFASTSQRSEVRRKVCHEYPDLPSCKSHDESAARRLVDQLIAESAP